MLGLEMILTHVLIAKWRTRLERCQLDLNGVWVLGTADPGELSLV